MAKFLTIGTKYAVAVADIVAVRVDERTGSVYVTYSHGPVINVKIPKMVSAKQFLRLCEIAEQSPQRLSMTWEEAVEILLSGKVPGSS